MNDLDFDYVPVYKLVDPSLKLKKIGRILLWTSIPSVLVSLFLATQISFTNNIWSNTVAGALFILSLVILFDCLLIGTLFFFLGSDYNRAPIRITLFGGELILYFENELIKRFYVSQIIKLETKILNLNKSDCKSIVLEYPKGKRIYILTQHIEDKYIERILKAFDYYHSVT